MNEAPQAREFEGAFLEAMKVARARSAELAGPSLIERLAELPRAQRESVLAQLSKSDLARIAYEWRAWARPKQRPDLRHLVHRVLVFLGGRGGGKSRTAAERIRDRIYAGARRVALLGPTTGEIEKFMLGVDEVDEGLLNVFHPRHRPRYVGRPTHMVHFHTGAIGYVTTAEKPEFRGANIDTAWCDEIIKWRYLMALWANLELATRAIAPVPIEIMVTTTPRPMRFLRELIADPYTLTLLTKTAENARNVSPLWLESMRRKYGGTRLGEQELEGELLGDLIGALFKASIIDLTRVESAPPGLRNVVAVDPAISTEPKNDKTGIVGMGDDEAGDQYIFADKSGRHKPEAWGRIVVDMYDQVHAEAVVAERNRGGDLVEANVRAAMQRKRGGIAAEAIKVVMVHASKGKAIRAEPVSALHERGRMHFVGRDLVELENEITEWDPTLGGPSPNGLDAMVWGSWYLGNLGEETKPDRSAGFRGLAAANAAARKLPDKTVPVARSLFVGARSTKRTI